ncbi:MAG: enoyl-CoA hydratase-related protein [Bdellovibrionota bacterium]
MSELVKFSQSESTIHLVINRPEARNALNTEVITSLTKHLEEIDNNNSIKSVLLYGEGEKAFCAGADLAELKNAKDESERRAVFQSVSDLVVKINKLSKPVIAKVHGYALAGGCGLAAACDLVIASDEAKFGLPEINIGLLPLIVMAPIHRAIGRRALMELTLTGEMISAKRALEIGLVTKVYPKADLDKNAEELANCFADKSSVALKLGKQAVYKVGELDYFEAFPELVNRVSAFSDMDDFEEGVNAFFEKRKANWSGK